MQIIGLTGGIASGKSEACRFLSQKCGISVIDTDAIGRKILETDQNCISNVLQVFPNCSACTADGDGEKSIDRVKLASEVFKKPEQRRKLESIIHPIIWSHVVYQLFLNWIKGTQRVIIDVPLLFEGRMHRLCSYTVLIACSTDIQRARLLVRNSKQQTPEAEDVALLRIHAQMKLESKLGLADVVIYNEDGLEDLFIELYSKISNLNKNYAILVRNSRLNLGKLKGMFGIYRLGRKSLDILKLKRAETALLDAIHAAILAV